MVVSMEWVGMALMLLFPLGVLFGGISDFLTLEIPNYLTAALAAVFVPVALAMFSWEQIGIHFASGIIVLALGFFAFARGWVGGGDAKLCAVSALWFGWPLVIEFLLWMGLLGGLFALLLLLARTLLPSLPLLERVAPFWFRAPKLQALPYGTPMAAAALYVFFNSVWL